MVKFINEEKNDNNKVRATKQFTDRDHPRKSFCVKYNHIKDSYIVLDDLRDVMPNTSIIRLNSLKDKALLLKQGFYFLYNLYNASFNLYISKLSFSASFVPCL